MLGVSPSAWWLVAHKGFVAGKADVEIYDDVKCDIGRCRVTTTEFSLYMCNSEARVVKTNCNTLTGVLPHTHSGVGLWPLHTPY